MLWKVKLGDLARWDNVKQLLELEDFQRFHAEELIAQRSYIIV